MLGVDFCKRLGMEAWFRQLAVAQINAWILYLLSIVYVLAIYASTLVTSRSYCPLVIVRAYMVRKSRALELFQKYLDGIC